jgi:hypothetical protein
MGYILYKHQPINTKEENNRYLFWTSLGKHKETNRKYEHFFEVTALGTIGLYKVNLNLDYIMIL